MHVRQMALLTIRLIGLLALGCSQTKTEPTQVAPPVAKTETQAPKELVHQPSVKAKPNETPSVSQPRPSPSSPPPSVPVTSADKMRIANAETKGAAAYEAQNGGYEIRIEAHTDANAILASLAGTKCIVGLSVEGDKLTDAAFAHMRDFTYLERLTLHSCPNVSGTGFDSLVGLSRFKSLAVSECPITDAACKSLGRIKSLEEVRFIHTKVTDAGLSELAAAPALESMSLEGSPVNGSAFTSAGWPKLRDLDATNAPLDDAGLEAIAGLPALGNLQVNSMKITDAGVRHLERAKKLMELSLIGVKMTDDGLAALTGPASLRVLDVSNTAITGVGFAKFPLRPTLRKLNASNTKFNDAGAANLAKFPGLMNLSLANCPVSDTGLTVLKDLKKLAHCNLSGTITNDDTAKIVGSLPGLEDANFAHTTITDAGVKALASGTKIRQIDVRGTKVTKEGAERAKMGRVRVEIRVE